MLAHPPTPDVSKSYEEEGSNGEEFPFIYRGVFRRNKNRTKLFRMDTLCTRYAVVSYLVILLLLCLASDDVQHELQRRSLMNIPERREPRKQTGIVCRCSTSSTTASRIVYVRHMVWCIVYAVRVSCYSTSPASYGSTNEGSQP